MKPPLRPGPAAGVPSRWGALLALAVMTLALTGCGGRSRSRPHIILVTSDALRFDHLSINGYRRTTSPTIDRFARKAWQFSDAVSVIPKTGPSLTTMFTGHHPEEHGVRSNFGAIPREIPMLAERLEALGYRTAAFVGNPVLRPGKGYARGFEDFEIREENPVREVNRAFLGWARQAWDRPTFVWIHYMDPHGPYSPPPDYEALFSHDTWSRSDERVSLTPHIPPGADPNKVLGAVPAYQVRDGEDRVAVYVARYDAEIRYMDAAFAEVLGYLEDHGLYDSSAIIFTADHGESLGEHNYYFEHGWFACEPTLHVPLMIKAPGQKEGGVVREQVSNMDFLPTVLALVHAPAVTPGVDLLAPIPQRPPLLIENSDVYPEKYYGVRTSRWKYVIRENDGAETLYDLRSDPLETRNLAEQRGDTRARLRKACRETLQATRASAHPPSEGEHDDPETRERLRSLGYVR